MLKLIYDLKIGFEDLFIVEKNSYIDLGCIVDTNNEMLARDINKSYKEDFIKNNPINELDFYNKYKDNVDELIDYLDRCGDLDCMQDSDREHFAHTYFNSICFPKDGEPCFPGICEYSNYRLVYDPNEKSDAYFNNAFTANEVYKLLNINRQQLHYYVKSGQIQKEYDPKDNTKFNYNKSDVYKVLDKLERKRPKINLIANNRSIIKIKKLEK